MAYNFTPEILTDKSRLQEIYDLRVIAYEASAKSMYVNRQTFPDGWSDSLDESETTVHWIVEGEGKIIGSARLAILEDPKMINENFTGFELPTVRPFAFWSRLVVHPDHRRSNAMMALDHVRKAYLLAHPEIGFAIGCVTADRSKAFSRLGFQYLGDMQYDWGGMQELSGFIFLR